MCNLASGRSLCGVVSCRLRSRVEVPLTLQWVQSNGGPLLLVTEFLQPSWAGVEAPDPPRLIQATFRFQQSGEPTDYDRACDAGGDYLGIVSVATGQALVLGDVPLQTAWVPEDNGPGGWLVRWEFAESEAEVERTLVKAQVPEWSPGPVFHTVPGNHCLFDAAIPGRDVSDDEGLIIHLAAPAYRVSTGFLRPDPETSLIVHWLQA